MKTNWRRCNPNLSDCFTGLYIPAYNEKHTHIAATRKDIYDYVCMLLTRDNLTHTHARTHARTHAHTHCFVTNTSDVCAQHLNTIMLIGLEFCKFIRVCQDGLNTGTLILLTLIVK